MNVLAQSKEVFYRTISSTPGRIGAIVLLGAGGLYVAYEAGTSLAEALSFSTKGQHAEAVAPTLEAIGGALGMQVAALGIEAVVEAPLHQKRSLRS